MTESKTYKTDEKQKTFGEEEIPIYSYKNIEEKRALKQKVLNLFNNEYFRSIIKTKDINRNKPNSLERLKQEPNESDIEYTTRRVTSFIRKDINTISIFPSTLTLIYTNMLSKENDKVYDPFIGHNSRAEDVLNLKRKYYGYDCHTFPIEFTKQALQPYDLNDYELNFGSSHDIKYPDNSFDFSITCPPYSDVEEYNKLYNENISHDLSSMNYISFLTLYKMILEETFRVLKPNSFFVIIVGNIITPNKYINLQYDTTTICQQIGFILHDINIYNRSSNIGGDLNYKNFILTSKRLPCIHEFILIFRKP